MTSCAPLVIEGGRGIEVLFSFQPHLRWRPLVGFTPLPPLRFPC
jgi:hypothetical protein